MSRTLASHTEILRAAHCAPDGTNNVVYAEHLLFYWGSGIWERAGQGVLTWSAPSKDLKPKSPVVSQTVTACLWPHLAGGALCVTPLAGAGGTSLRKPAPDPSHSPFLVIRLCPYHTAVINLGREYNCIQLLWVLTAESGMVNTPLYPQNPAQYLTFRKWFTTYFLKGKWKWSQRTRAKATLWKFSKELRNRTYQLHSNNPKNVHTSKNGRMKLIQES